MYLFWFFFGVLNEIGDSSTKIIKFIHIFQMDAELQQFNNERMERIRQLNDKHEKELETFDDESTRMGFR